MRQIRFLSGLFSSLGFRESPIAHGNVGSHAEPLIASLLSMAWFVEARDPYTGGHLWRVSRYARMTALRAGLGHAEAAKIGLGGFLHDLGKVGVPDAILRKAGQLTDEEYAIIKTHPSVGARMLAGHPLARLVEDAVLLHHERPDGRGYPKSLRGADIPDMALVVGVCDAFDAMTSHRPYRAGMPIEKALHIIASEKGSQFDGRFGDALAELGKAGELDHIAGHSDEGIPLQSCPNCGPTLVLHRDSKPGKLIYCRNCTGQFKLAYVDGSLTAQPSGSMGSPADLEPELDVELIRRTVQEAAAEFPLVLAAIDFAIAKDYPARGEYAGPA